MTTRTCNFLKSSYKTKEAPCILGMQEFKQKLGSSIFWYADVYNVHVSKSEFCYRNNIFLTKTSFGFGTLRFLLAVALFLPLILFECVICFGCTMYLLLQKLDVHNLGCYHSCFIEMLSKLFLSKKYSHHF